MTPDDLLAACRAAMPGVEWRAFGQVVRADVSLLTLSIWLSAPNRWTWTFGSPGASVWLHDHHNDAQQAIAALAAAVDEAATQLARVRKP